jgi:hypothetical protein
MQYCWLDVPYIPLVSNLLWLDRPPECPKCGGHSEIIARDDEHEENSSSDQEEASSDSSYDSLDYSGSSDSSDSWSDSTSTGRTSSASSSGSGTGILSIIGVILLFLFFKYGNVGTQQQTNSVVVSPSPTPTISENESAEQTQLPITLSVSPQEVTALKFYESGYNVPIPIEQRLYSNTFFQGSVRYIYWELTLETPGAFKLQVQHGSFLLMLTSVS